PRRGRPGPARLGAEEFAEGVSPASAVPRPWPAAVSRRAAAGRPPRRVHCHPFHACSPQPGRALGRWWWRKHQRAFAEAAMEERQQDFLFDLDGTLIDSVYQHVLAWQDALDQMGIELAVWRIHRKMGMSGGLFSN